MFDGKAELAPTSVEYAVKILALALCVSSVLAPYAAFGQSPPTPPSPASAAPSARLVYVLGVGTDHCPDEDTYRSEVLARLGIDPFTATAPTVIEASIEHQGANFRGTIVRRDANGTVTGRRDLTQLRDCAALVSRMAVSTSIALNPVSPDTPVVAPPAPPIPGPAGPEGPPGPPGPPGPAGACQSCRETPAPPRSARRVRLGVGGFVSVLSAPSPTGGVTVHADLRAADWSVGADIRIDVPVSLDLPAVMAPRIAAGSTLVTRSILAEVSGCLHRRWFFGCLAGSTGSMLSRFQNAAPEAGFLLSFGARAGAEYSPLSGFTLRAWAAGDFHVRAAVVRVSDGVDTAVVWDEGPLSFSAGVMALLALP